MTHFFEGTFFAVFLLEIIPGWLWGIIEETVKDINRSADSIHILYWSAYPIFRTVKNIDRNIEINGDDHM
jgi:hypothetical protein